MYSAVLMLALTAGSETADFGRNRGCAGASNCAPCGQVAYTCGSGAYGGAAYSCSGYGGGYACGGGGGGHGGLFARGGHGCSGGGGLFRRGHGGHGASGCSCGPVAPVNYGGCGGMMPYGGGGCGMPVIVDPKTNTKPMPKSGEPLPAPKAGEKKTSATIVVSLPADARLIVDGNATTSTSDRRTLFTPALEVGSTYVYSMRAEIVRDGRTESQTQQVTVRGGEVSNIQFNFASGVASR